MTLMNDADCGPCLVWTGLCLVLPGLALTNIAPGVTGVLLMTLSLGLCALETILYWQGEGMYPSALFCATAALGFALSRRLEYDKRITPTVGWILRCVYLSKGAVVVVPNVWAYPAALFVTLCVSPLFMEGEGRGRAVSPTKTLFLLLDKSFFLCSKNLLFHRVG